VINERIARNSNRLAALGALLLPPALIAGLLGMNVGGIPGGSEPWAFVAVCALVVGLSAAVLWVLRRMGWF
jgi:zinc transporter